MMPFVAVMIWLCFISAAAVGAKVTGQSDLTSRSYWPPSETSFTVNNPRNHEDPVVIHITNVVSPQITSNSNAISTANSPIPPNTIIPPVSSINTPAINPLTDYRRIPFLTGTSLIPFLGDPKSVKLIYIPVFVSTNNSMPSPTSGNTGSATPGEKNDLAGGTGHPVWQAVSSDKPLPVVDSENKPSMNANKEKDSLVTDTSSAVGKRGQNNALGQWAFPQSRSQLESGIFLKS